MAYSRCFLITLSSCLLLLSSILRHMHAPGLLSSLLHCSCGLQGVAQDVSEERQDWHIQRQQGQVRQQQAEGRVSGPARAFNVLLTTCSKLGCIGTFNAFNELAQPSYLLGASCCIASIVCMAATTANVCVCFL